MAATINTTIAKTSAILDECAILADRIEAPLADLELIREIEGAEAIETSAIEAANRSIETHIERVRGRVLMLATAIHSVPLSLPAGSPDADLEMYFSNVEAVAGQVNSIG